MAGPAIPARTFTAIIAVVAVVAVNNRAGDSDPVAGTGAAPQIVIDREQPAAALPGRPWTVVDGLAGSRPDTIEFGENGSYRVIQRRSVVDSGVYTAEGDIVTFESDPTDEVMWVENDAFVRVAKTCEGFIGEYRVGVTQPNRITLEAVWDECTARITVANGLHLEPTMP